jgi:anthranilate synthase component II
MILIIDNYDSFTYNLYQGVVQFHPEVRVIRNDKITIDDINHLDPDGIILSPGPGRPEEAGICVELVNALVTNRLDSAIPLLGVCLGHQAITVALGGQVIQSHEIVHGKFDMIFHHRKGLYKNMPLPFQAGRYHSLIADRTTLPATLFIEAEDAAELVMGIRHAILPIYGVQFHPESILTPKGNDFLQAFTEQCINRKGEVYP